MATGTPLPVVHYTSKRETKDFIEREASKLEPGGEHHEKGHGNDHQYLVEHVRVLEAPMISQLL